MIASLCIIASFLTGQAASARSLVIGTISNEPVSEIRKFFPFAEYLAGELESAGISGGNVHIARDIDQMALLLQTGQIDLYFDSPLVAIAVNKSAGSRMLVRRWKNETKEYSSVIFVRRDSGIGAVGELAGKMIAFEDDFSSSGYFLPRIALEGLGIQLVRMTSHREKPAGVQTGFIFSDDDENTSEWVLRGRVDAGAMSVANFEKYGGSRRDELSTVLRTDAIPRHIVSIGPGVSEHLSADISSALINMDKSEEGREVLFAFDRTTKFDAIPAETANLFEQYREPLFAIINEE